VQFPFSLSTCGQRLALVFYFLSRRRGNLNYCAAKRFTRFSLALGAAAAAKEYWATEQQLPNFCQRLISAYATSQLMPLYDGQESWLSLSLTTLAFLRSTALLRFGSLASKDHWLVTLISSVWTITCIINFQQIFVSGLSYEIGMVCVSGFKCIGV
jgi:hypothetical protein